MSYRPLHNETPEQEELRELRGEYVRLLGCWMRAERHARSAQARLSDLQTSIAIGLVCSLCWTLWTVLS